jgi:hypothetical protein
VLRDQVLGKFEVKFVGEHQKNLQRLERFVFAQVAPLANGQIAQFNFADTHAL